MTYRGKDEFSDPVNARGAAGTSDRRRGERTRAVYRLVHVQNERDEGLARCCNISDGGMALRLTMPVRLNDTVKVAFSPSVVLEGQVAWVNGGDCGVKFAETIDSGALLRETSAEARSEGARAPRLKTEMPARVLIEGRVRKTIIQDVSQSGVKLSHEGEFQPGLPVKVMLPDGEEKDGVVRWSSENIAGLYLIDPFSVDDLGSVSSLSQHANGMPAKSKTG